MSKRRNIISEIWQTFLKSFNVAPRQFLGELKGEDHLGNKYYELAADPRGGRRRSSRWFEAEDSTDLTPKIPREWQAWLRRQRDVPPTQDEILRNAAKAQMKQENAAKLKEKFGFKDAPKDEPIYPHFSDYQTNPTLEKD